uniref:F-box domain-containing protein n=1 Tax=Mycena chlorophos TaxID=658473 RepID=A0ABQ0M820_MYCCL|nr:predicted protein [Mycena chlorophos]
MDKGAVFVFPMLFKRVNGFQIASPRAAPGPQATECLQIDEILVEIIRLSLEPQDNSYLVSIRHTITSLVSRAWRSCINKTPSLWSSILLSPDMSQEGIDHQFNCAKSISKDVYIDLITPALFHIFPLRLGSIPFGSTHVLAFIVPHLLAHAGTIHPLSFRAHNYVGWNDFARRLQSVPMAAFKTISIDIPRATPHPLQLIPIVASPQLLNLNQGSLQCVAASYAALETLILGGSVFSAADATAFLDILHVLSQTKHLRHLRLDDSDNTTWLSGFARIHLPHLLSLAIICTRHTHRGGCGKLASYLVTPSLKALMVSGAHRLEVSVVNPEKFLLVAVLTLTGMDCRDAA